MDFLKNKQSLTFAVLFCLFAVLNFQKTVAAAVRRPVLHCPAEGCNPAVGLLVASRGSREAPIYCSGSLIAPGLFLTASHCLNAYTQRHSGAECSNISVYFPEHGRSTTAPTNAQCTQVVSASTIREFSDAYHAPDYALIRIESPRSSIVQSGPFIETNLNSITSQSLRLLAYEIHQNYNGWLRFAEQKSWMLQENTGAFPHELTLNQWPVIGSAVFLNGVSIPGSSGGAILNLQNQLVGVHYMAHFSEWLTQEAIRVFGYNVFHETPLPQTNFTMLRCVEGLPGNPQPLPSFCFARNWTDDIAEQVLVNQRRQQIYGDPRPSNFSLNAFGRY